MKLRLGLIPNIPLIGALIFQSHFAFAKPAEVILLGTVHQNSQNVTAKDIEHVLTQLVPDIVLFEHPINWDNGNYITELHNARSKGDATSIEAEALLNYYKSNPSVIVKAYDIAERNRFYQEENYFEKEQAFFNDFLKYYEASSTPRHHKVIIEQILSSHELKALYAQQPLNELNSSVGDLIVKNNLKGWHGAGLEELATAPKLKKHIHFITLMRKFWQSRNEAMVSNITHIANAHKDKRIIVITGFEHRYKLKTLIEEQNTISLTELNNVL